MTPTKIFGYCRVSTGKQERSGLSLSAQEEEIRKFALMNNLEIVDIKFETVSGGYPLERRPVLKSLFNSAAKIKGCAVVTAKLDRLSRKVSFISALMEEGVPFYCADCGLNTSSLELHIRAVVAEEEKRKIAERTSAAAQQRIREGRPVGFKIPVNIENGVQQKAIKESKVALKYEADEWANFMKRDIQRAMRDGLSLREIVKEFNDEGRPTRRGGSWHLKTLQNLIARW